MRGLKTFDSRKVVLAFVLDCTKLFIRFWSSTKRQDGLHCVVEAGN